MRTLTVKEAAQALGVSVRTVQHRLNTGELKGKRTPNQYGVSEWRVWPNKEIMERLTPGRSFDEIDFSTPPEEFQGGDSSAVIDAEAVETDRVGNDLAEPSLRMIVRELTQEFSEQLSREKSIVAQLQRDLEDKDRQLKLLPDFEKQAEAERKAAELKELEAEALRKQINALQTKQNNEATQKIEELERVLSESQKKADEEIQRLKLEKEVQAKAIEELRAAEEAKLAEKEAEAKAIQEQLAGLSATIEDLRTPWWKKLFSAGDKPDASS